MADRGRYGRDVGHTRPDLHCSNRRELTIALANLYESAGAPSLDALAERAGGTRVLPRSSAAAIINRSMLPVSFQQLVAYLKGCGVPTRVHNQWIYAWVMHGGRGHQRSTKAGKSSVTQILTADLADIIQTGTVDQEKLNSIIRNLIVLMPDPATELELVMSVVSQRPLNSDQECGCSQRRAAARVTSTSSLQEQTSSHDR
ncbi:hypothetical protein ACFC0K_41105 [Streptomyces hydrogenans]|uniref:hypothetical protein n=1 Tax=Streptomyces hydrogenans TaxID=1873719 RepID=UPI0035D88732